MKKTEFSQLSTKKKAFVEHYIQTKNITESYFAAGYKSDCNKRDPKERKKAYQAGAEILKNPMIQEYIATHQPIPIPVQGDIDEKAITDRLFLICMGNIEQQYLVKGDLVYLKPTFKESIEAGKVLMMISQKREKKEGVRASKALNVKIEKMINSARVLELEAPEEDEE